MEYYKISNTELISIYSDSLCNGFKINSNEVLELEEEFTYRIFSEEEFQIIKLITTEVNRNIYSKLHTKLENFDTPLSNYNFSESIFNDIFKEYHSISKGELINNFLQLKNYTVEGRKVIIDKMKEYNLINPSNIEIIRFIEKNSYLFYGTEKNKTMKKISKDILMRFYEVYTTIPTKELIRNYSNWKEFHLEEIKIIEDELICRGYPHLIDENIKPSLEKENKNILENNIYNKETKKYLELNLKSGINGYNGQMRAVISLFLFLGALLITFSISEFIIKVDTMSWIKNSATITGIDVKKETRTFFDKGTQTEKTETYEVGEISYEYIVNGIEYVCSFQKTSFLFGLLKTQYKEGTLIDIYYNPKNPENHDLEIYNLVNLMLIPLGFPFLWIYWWMRKKYELEGYYRHITLKDVKIEIIYIFILSEIGALFMVYHP